MSPHEITKVFEARICDYTGSPYCVTLENESHALFLALTYDKDRGDIITIPSNTYPSVPCEILHAGSKVKFDKNHKSLRKLTKKEKRDYGKIFINSVVLGIKILKGDYRLLGTKVIDSALRFTADMYIPGTYTCCSFTGPYKHLKLGKGGCILTDNGEAYKWFKRARYSGRRECNYHEDDLSMTGWNFYMNPVISQLGLLLMGQFYNFDGTKKDMPDISIPYPDLSKSKIYTDEKK